MILTAIISLILGIICGQFFFSDDIIKIFSYIADYALYITMFSVGISVGLNSSVFSKIRQYHFKILLIPMGIVIGTLIGGALCSILLNEKLTVSLAITSGMGWYSLSGVLITDLVGADAGAIAFLSNLMREIISFIIIPPIAINLNHYTAIAPAGATSEDTTLPVLIKYANTEIVIVAVINGVVCSALVPLLINMFLTL
ncbi:MAG: putative rane protein [Clostridia bacterium]|nr:putative rane protein [Clostridia bacterium]